MGWGIFSCFKNPNKRRPSSSTTRRRHRDGRRRSRQSANSPGGSLTLRTRADGSATSGLDSPRPSVMSDGDDGYFSAVDQDDLSRASSAEDFQSPRFAALVSGVAGEPEQPGLLDRLAAWWDIRQFPDEQPTLTQALNQLETMHRPLSPPQQRTSVNMSSNGNGGGNGVSNIERVNSGGGGLSTVDSGGGGLLTAGSIPTIHENVVLEPELPTGCISLFTASQSLLAHKRFLRLLKPPAGSSFSRLVLPQLSTMVSAAGSGPTTTAAAALPSAYSTTTTFNSATSHTDNMNNNIEPLSCVWEDVDPADFQVRSQNYMKSKKKEPCADMFYKLVGVDMYTFDFKIHHIAQHVELPPPPVLSPAAYALPKNEQIAPMIIMNLQLPTYSASLFGGSDGPGLSLVYYFALPENWDPTTVANKNALAMLQRFTHNGREFDGQPTRDRLKLIGRVCNVDEWIQTAPLSGPEAHLLKKYNDTPLLTRPQHRYYTGPGGAYLEVDLDVHNYAYLARRALSGYINRLNGVVFENSFLLQGNRPEELPEVLLGGARMYRIDFLASRPFPAVDVEGMRVTADDAHDGDPVD